jgi:uncharacterized protein
VRIRTDLPRPVREIENTWIPLADGCRLAARMWLPADAESDPVPAILEYIPYRKTDGTALRDAPRHPYVAGHGYASVRVDMRGSGESDGILRDEYLKQEHDDALEVLRWLAAQPWCTGRVGMIGISWGGFNGLQIAARRPPELGAVITLMSTDDRYADDVHYKGGCVLAWDMLPWAAGMLAFNARPPDPRLVGDRWREMWLERLDKTPYIEHWMAHQRRDDYWKHGSVCEDYAAITCPVYAIGGWADGYTNAVSRLLAGLTAPRKGLIGPWSHSFPDESVPGPSIGFGQECLRWWDHWLKGIDTGVMDEPMLRVWMQETVPPRPQYELRPGRWIAEDEWPSSRIEERELALGDGTLGEPAVDERALELAGLQTAGQDAGVWCGAGQRADSPPDQRREDGVSLAFTSAPLAEPLELLGFPEVTLALAVDRPQALVAVRLCEVFPDGTSALVTRGLLNLAHRESHEHPSPLEPGRRTVVRVRLDAVAHSFAPDQRLRLAVSPTYWPWAWPSPDPVRLTVYAGADSRLGLPVRPTRAADAELAPFGESEGAPPLASETLRAGFEGRMVTADALSGRVEQVFDWDLGGLVRLPDIDLDSEDTSRSIFSIVEGEPLSAQVRCECTTTMARGDWRTRADVVSTMSADRDAFHLTTQLDAYEGDVRVFARTWSTVIPRDHV